MVIFHLLHSVAKAFDLARVGYDSGGSVVYRCHHFATHLVDHLFDVLLGLAKDEKFHTVERWPLALNLRPLVLIELLDMRWPGAGVHFATLSNVAEGTGSTCLTFSSASNYGSQ